MPLVYITGVSGSGKSTLCDELVRRGHDAHDSDRDGNASVVSRLNGEHVAAPSLEGRTPEFVAEFEWRFVRAAVERLATRATDRTVFFLGTAANEREVWGLFDVTIYLAIDELTLRQRLANRTGNDFGKSDERSFVDDSSGWRKRMPSTPTTGRCISTRRDLSTPFFRTSSMQVPKSSQRS